MEHEIIAKPLERDQDRRLVEIVLRERNRLLNFIRKRVPDHFDAEDILQEVFYELIEAYRLLQPIENAGAWLFRVTRNRVADRFRKKRLEALDQPVSVGDTGEQLFPRDLLASSEAGPEATYNQAAVLDRIEEALRELPENQRRAFIAHEIEGRSFKEIAADTGESVNTLLSRKRYAVLYLRRRLRDVYWDSQNNNVRTKTYEMD